MDFIMVFLSVCMYVYTYIFQFVKGMHFNIRYVIAKDENWN